MSKKLGGAKAFSFVEMESPEAAKFILDTFNKKELLGQTVEIKETTYIF